MGQSQPICQTRSMDNVMFTYTPLPHQFFYDFAMTTLFKIGKHVSRLVL